MKTTSILAAVLVLACGCATTRKDVSPSEDPRAAIEAILSEGKGTYPDYLYTLVGLLSVEGPHSVGRDVSGDSFGTFWQGEYHVARDLYALLLSLRDRGLISGSVTIATDAVGRTDVTSKGGKELITSLFVTEKDGFWGMSLRYDFFRHATNGQKLLYLDSVYKRWGVRGYNLFINPDVNHDWLMGLLGPYTSDIKTIQGESAVPGIRVVIFNPDDRLAQRLGITQRASINLGVGKNESPDLLVWKFPYATYDERHSISLHLAELDNLADRDLSTRLEYLSSAKRELKQSLKYHKEQDSDRSRAAVTEITELIQRIDKAIAQQSSLVPK